MPQARKCLADAWNYHTSGSEQVKCYVLHDRPWLSEGYSVCEVCGQYLVWQGDGDAFRAHVLVDGRECLSAVGEAALHNLEAHDMLSACCSQVAVMEVQCYHLQCR